MNDSSSTDGKVQNFTKDQTNFQPPNDQVMNLDIPSIGRNSSLKLRMYCDEYKLDALLYNCVRNDYMQQNHKSISKQKLYSLNQESHRIVIYRSPKLL